MGKTDEDLEPFRIGELVEVSIPIGELQQWDGSVGIIMTRRRIVEKQLDLPGKPPEFSDQENFRNLNCWEYEVLVQGKVRWFTHYSLLKYEEGYVN